MAKKLSKADLIAALKLRLEEELATATLAHKTTKDAATHEEAKPENDKDTRALEQSYLARGQAQRVLDLQAAVHDVAALGLRIFGEETPIALTALVGVEDEDGAEASYFGAPAGGGTRLMVGKKGVTVVTPKAPLGAALLGKRVGDEVTVVLAGRARTVTIVSVD
mgnify:FL=1